MAPPKKVRLNRTRLSIDENCKQVWQKLEREPKPYPDLTLLPEMTIFNNPVDATKHLQEYDHFFAYTRTFPLYDKRKERCNRNFLPDIHENIFQQEKRKPIPVLMELDYGRPCRVQADKPEGLYNRSNVMESMSRPFGVMPFIEREAPSEIPQRL